MESFTALGVAVNIFQIVELSHGMFSKVNESKETGTTTFLTNNRSWPMRSLTLLNGSVSSAKLCRRQIYCAKSRDWAFPGTADALP